MLKTCVIVADRARARLFVTMEPPARTLGTAPVTLHEVEALTDPEGEVRGADLFSNARSGTNRSPHGAAFEYDDHRQGHREEAERHFSKRVASAIRSLLDREHATRLVLAVDPRLLGMLRPTLSQAGLPEGLERIEIPLDLSSQAPAQIVEVLQRHGALGSAVG
jgi:hypothetical protein